jgi:DNA repair ATPase RecN
MNDRVIEMDLNDLYIIRESMAEIENISRKYNMSAYHLIEKVNKVEKVKV